MSNSASLQFLGAAGTVTGSKHLVRHGRHRVLLDCGLFQGLKELRLRNWAKPPFDVNGLDAVVLSHAHIDHSGYLPLLARYGFKGPVYCTSATADLLEIMLPDSAHLQEEDAARANRYGYSKHKPALPLYTTADAHKALKLLEPRPYAESFQVSGDITAVFRRTGHILGAASIDLQLGDGSPTRVVFSGDLGRWSRPILRDPEFVAEADYLLVESTYGDRTHAPDSADSLARIVNEAAQRGGALLVPAFAVGRTQELVWAIDVTHLYCRHPEDHDLDMKLRMDEKRCPLCCKEYRLARTPEESKALNDIQGPVIIISASGMATGGRILHHLKLRLPDPKTTVLLPGFQSIGTRGRALQEGAREVRIHGMNVPVRAKVEVLHGLSGHADRTELLRWLKGFQRPPRHTYIVHGESGPAISLAEAIRGELSWDVSVAKDGEAATLE
jgi:metallo-beta-lactamase family protein